MQKNKNRTLVTLVAVILAAAVFTSVLTMAISALDFLIRGEKLHSGSYYARFSYLEAEKAAEIERDQAVKDASSFDVLGFVKLEEKESNWSSFILANIDENFSSMMPVMLIEGRMPQGSREILLPKQAVDVFSYYGLPHTVGEVVSLDAVTYYEELASVLGNAERTAFSEDYTIVGIYENYAFDEVLVLQSILSCAEESDEVLYRNVFVTTEHPADAYELAREYPEAARVHTRLLSYYGATEYVNYNTVIRLIAAAVILVVMIAAVSVIYHAFSASVSERTRDFGLLCSVGATKKQIRRSVLLEAGLLSCIGAPIGFLFGFSADALLFFALGKRIENLIVSAMGEEGGAQIHAVLSPAVMLAVLVVTVMTVVIAVWIPAARASRAIPMDAIRQTSEYKLDKKAGKTRNSGARIFGVAGMMAEKYNGVSRKKFRPIVMALTLSIVMLLTATSLGDMIETVAMANARMENHDFRLYQVTDEQLRAIRDSGLVTRCAWIGGGEHSYAYAPDEAFSVEFRDAYADIQAYDKDRTLNIQHAKLVYVEDAVLESYLLEHGIDPGPYLSKEDPTALLCDMRLFTPFFQNENGEWVQYHYQLMPFDRKTESVLFLSYFVPEEIQAHYMKSDETWMWGYVSENGKLLAEMTPSTTTIVNGTVQPGGFDEGQAIYFEVVVSKDASGASSVAYYEYDKETGVSSAAPICTLEGETAVREYKIGAHITERPFGVEEPISGKIELILPLSAAEASAYLAVDTNQYLMFRSLLDEMNVLYADNCEAEENARTVRMLIDILSYGFVILISVLCFVGALNTMMASVITRRRDFAMLRSIGSDQRGIRRILILENVLHGLKAVLLGVPIGLLIHVGIYFIQREAVITSFSMPWRELLLSVSGVFAIVLMSIFFALQKLRGENLVDALKTETT